MSNYIKRVDQVADVVKTKRNPTEKPKNKFQYIDISSVDVQIGRILNPQELIGSKAPSRARKVVLCNDIIVSTCRPMRGAIAIIPDILDNEICSTGFSVWRAINGEILPQYLHWALRTESTLEQFRKWSTGSSYPAILDGDVAKTRIPVPDIVQQQEIVEIMTAGLQERDRIIADADSKWLEIKENVKCVVSSINQISN